MEYLSVNYKGKEVKIEKLDNGHFRKPNLSEHVKISAGVTWLDNCRIPYANDGEIERIEAKMGNSQRQRTDMLNGGLKKHPWTFDKKIGRFPTNMLCENDSMDGDSNGDQYSKYFSLEAWFEKYIHDLPQEVQNTFPFLITPKPSKSEKNKNLPTEPELSQRPTGVAYNEHSDIHSKKEKGNIHPTIKPLKLITWLIILASREGDVILDPFMGSGTTPLAAKMTHRQYKGIELEEEFFNTAVKRVDATQQSMDRFL